MELQKEILFLKSKLKYIRAVARHLGIDRETVKKYWEQDEQFLIASPLGPSWALQIDWDYIAKETSKGISIKTLYNEHLGIKDLPTYANFARYYRMNHQAENTVEISLKVERTPGQSLEVDYSGDKMEILNPATGEISTAELFVACLSYSSYFYAEFTSTQRLNDFLDACKNAIHHFGKVPKFIVPDNCLTAVTKAEKHDAQINRNFKDFCHHYGIIADPARIYKPKDKPHVENSIGVIQKEFFQKYRATTFTSIYELNRAMWVYLKTKMNQVIPCRGKTRQQLFEEELAVMKDLPSTPFEFFTYKNCKVHPDCHIRHQKNCYSVPHRFVGKEVEAKISSKMIYIFFEAEEIAVHALIFAHGLFVTNKDHYPEQKMTESNYYIQSQLKRAAIIGPHTESLVNKIFNTARNHPLRNLAKVQCVLGLSETYSKAGLEYASEVAIQGNKFTYYFIKSCTKNYRNSSKKQTLLPSRQREFICLQGGLS